MTANRYSPNDAEIRRRVGVPPERADSEPPASVVVLVDTPGSFAIALSRFGYERLRAPRCPPDDDEYPDW